MRRPTQSRFGLLPARQIPATAAICAAMLVVSLGGILLQRFAGFGVPNIDYRVPAVMNLELWRLATYPFAIGRTFDLLLSLLVMWLFGGWFESSYGTRDYVRFFFAATIGAAIVAIPLTWLINLVLPTIGFAQGPDPAFDAMLMALVLTAPNANILFGFVLPMRAKTVIYIILGIHLITAIMDGASTISVSLAGLLMGWLLITGNWRPNRIKDHFKMWTLRKRRRGLYVVPPKDKTLH